MGNNVAELQIAQLVTATFFSNAIVEILVKNAERVRLEGKLSADNICV